MEQYIFTRDEVNKIIAVLQEIPLKYGFDVVKMIFEKTKPEAPPTEK